VIDFFDSVCVLIYSSLQKFIFVKPSLKLRFLDVLQKKFKNTTFADDILPLIE
jgi:hypothetical protein